MDNEGVQTMSEGEPVLIELNDLEKTDLVNLQMLLVSSSMNHEYTRKAYEKTRSFHRKQELLSKMNRWKALYFTARNHLVQNCPERLESIENELRLQKLSVFSEESLN
jgi:hypothetical protein